jgi:hypothetical protein
MIGGMSHIPPIIAEGECHPDLKVTISLGTMAGLEPGKSEST